jgi:hypothetical protein
MDVDDNIAGKNALINEDYTILILTMRIAENMERFCIRVSDIMKPSSPLQRKQVIPRSPSPYSGLFNNMIKSGYHRR